MTISQGYPPNYAAIVKAIPAVKLNKGIVFTYGDTIFMPAGINLVDHLMAHEQEHIRQQTEMGAEKWWAQYLKDPQFRLEQELEAYKVQYQTLQKNHSRQDRRVTLMKIAGDLGGSMYGKIINKEMARKLITGDAQL